MKAPACDCLVVIEEQLADAVEHGALGRRVVAVQARERVESAVAKLGAVAVGSIESVRAQRRAERGEQRRRAGAPVQRLLVMLGQWRHIGRRRPVESSEDLNGSKLSRLQSRG